MARSEHILKSTGSKKAVRQQIHWIVRWTGIQWILWSAERALSITTLLRWVRLRPYLCRHSFLSILRVFREKKSILEPICFRFLAGISYIFWHVGIILL
jgi:hypothetical protein